MPVIVPSLVAKGAIVLAGGRIAFASRPASPGARAAGEGLNAANRDLLAGGGWVWPLPVLASGAKPCISDGPGTNKRTDLDGTVRGHNGCDIDYQRPDRQYLIGRYPVGSHEGTALFYCPTGTPVIAMRAGKLWSASESPRGWQVVIDHGKPWCSYYQHLSKLFVPVRKGGGGGPVIAAGQVIGVVGYDPTQGARGFNHLHAELWQNGGAERWVDPTPILKGAGYVTMGSLAAQLHELGHVVPV